MTREHRQAERDSHLARRLKMPIVFHLARPGLSVLLKRTLTGTPAFLWALIEEQNGREGVPSA